MAFSELYRAEQGLAVARQTLRLLQDAPIYAGAQQVELVTPTGALLVTAYADSPDPRLKQTITRMVERCASTWITTPRKS